jgi:hypothetical protein
MPATVPSAPVVTKASPLETGKELWIALTFALKTYVAGLDRRDRQRSPAKVRVALLIERGAAPPRDKEIRNLRARVGGRAPNGIRSKRNVDGGQPAQQRSLRTDIAKKKSAARAGRSQSPRALRARESPEKRLTRPGQTQKVSPTSRSP